MQAYFQKPGIALPTVISISIDDGQNLSADDDVDLDIEVAGAITPSAKIAVYFPPNTDQGFLDAVTQTTHDMTNNPTVISISRGGPESTWTAQTIHTMDQAFRVAVSPDIIVCSTAGDNGSSGSISDGKAHIDFSV